ncbi:MAG: DNA polymerase III subunit alpha, partial [Clostridiales bacterium]|nr:DNA polymerase III subunit alpha [Clostridiales bacterium]
RPENFEDIVAGISLYRPGPMDFIPDYIKGKNNPGEITYVTPELEPILRETYGCIVYQEQVMQIFQRLAGYTMGQADNIRRAMSKKKQYVIDEERQAFVYGDEARQIGGCVANGIDEKAANRIYDSMVDFAKYAFNKSHAAAYAVISMQTAWLKCYYPVAFMAALMTSVIDNSAKAAQYLAHCKEMGIQVLPPDVNVGEGTFTAEGGNIRYGMYAIKSLGRTSVDKIINERKAGGPYRTLLDLIERTEGTDINKRAMENLIKAGACDSLDGTRKQMVLSCPTMMDDVAHRKKNNMSGQMSLFDIASDEDKKDFSVKYPDSGEFSKDMLLGFEKEVLGIYLSGHPLDDYAERMKNTVTAQAIDLVRDDETGAVKIADGEHVVVGGSVVEKKIKYTKNNQVMAYLTLEDLTGSIDIIVFPKPYEKYQQFIAEDSRIFVAGHASVDDAQGDGSVICEKIAPLDATKKEVWLQFGTKDEFSQREQELYAILGKPDGADEVVIYVASPRAVKRLGSGRRIRADGELMSALSAFVGENNCKVVEKPLENFL